MESAHNTHWIGDWIGPEISLDSLEKRKVFYSSHKWNHNFALGFLLHRHVSRLATLIWFLQNYDC